LNSENSSGPGETGAQSQGSESSVARPLGSEAATPAPAADAASGEGSAANGARDEGEAKAAIAQRAEFIKAERNFFAGKIGRNHEIGDSPVAVASFDGAAADPLSEASAALDDRDYATAQRLFEAVGRKDVAEAIKDALAALDRKDFAKAQGLFEALSQKGAAAVQVTGAAAAARVTGDAAAQVMGAATQVKEAAAAQMEEAAAAHVNESAPASPAPPKPATLAGGPMASDSWNKALQRPLASAPEVVPLADAAYRRPPPQAEKAKSRRLKPLFLGAGLVALAVFGVSAIYGSPLNWAIPVTKSQAIAGLSSGAHILKADLEAVRGGSAQKEEPSATRDPNAPLTQLTERLDQIEREYGARLDKLGERFDQDSSSRFADIAARLDKLEKKAALPATPPSESAEIVARLDKLEKRIAAAAAPASEIASLTTRLNKLEKRAAVAAASSANPLPPAAPRQSSLVARAERSAPNETARPADPGPVLRDYSVESVRDGVAVIDGRDGPQEVAPGDFVPGAGRVLRIEKQGNDWFVLTSRGVIASGPAP
jgi:tetrahydromethanopterin S-methyltransferase subunit G